MIGQICKVPRAFVRKRTEPTVSMVQHVHVHEAGPRILLATVGTALIASGTAIHLQYKRAEDDIKLQQERNKAVFKSEEEQTKRTKIIEKASEKRNVLMWTTIGASTATIATALLIATNPVAAAAIGTYAAVGPALVSVMGAAKLAILN